MNKKMRTYKDFPVIATKEELEIMISEEAEKLREWIDDEITKGYLMNNTELKDKYDEMHKVGVSSWFSDGREERETILKMGEPWSDGYGNLDVLEIGCGEGELAELIATRTAKVIGIDYSEEAIKKAKAREKHFLMFEKINYRDMTMQFDRIVMQGVLEHLDSPFVELKWMIDNLLVKGGDVITSSPCFMNPRGVVWMTLDMLGAVMSKTDLHYLSPREFTQFGKDNGYEVSARDCDASWGNGIDMIKDLKQRIPLALRDGGLPCDLSKLKKLLRFLSTHTFYGTGATMVYRIST